ncbi:MAG TPA: cellulase family glycosylhydrolase [Verrucomicrobiae bacterium]
MKKPLPLIKITLVAFAVAAMLLAPAPARAGTSWAHGGNWADIDGNVAGVHYWVGISNTTTLAQATNVADTIACEYASVGINFVRLGFNPETVTVNWPVAQVCINQLIAKGMNVDVCCFYIDWKGSGTITNMSNWENMWETIDGVYKNNNSVYYEAINEPFGYSLSSLEGVYTTFLGFITKRQDHILLDGTGYADNVTGIGGDTSFSGCLLALHDYAVWNTSLTTEAQWESQLQTAVGSYYGRTIITEMGAASDTGLDYSHSANDNNISFIRAMCEQCLSWGMGFTYFPATIPRNGNGTINDMRLFEGVNGEIVNESLIFELESGWNVAQFTPEPAPCVARTADGRLELFAIGTDNSLYTAYQQTGGGWSGWAAMTTQTFAQNAVPVVGTNSDGRLEVLIVDTEGHINYASQLTPGSSAATNWSAFTPMTSAVVAPTAHLALGTWANGCLDVFAIGTGSNLIHANQQTSGGWTSFTSLGGALFSQSADIGVNNELDGREEVILIGTGGNLCQNYQTAANSATWSGWNNLGNSLPPTAHTALGRNSDGRLEIFSIGSGGNACHAWENAANTPGSWASLANLGGTWATTARVSVAADQNGALETFILGTDGNMYHGFQTGGGWSGWSALSGCSFNQNVMQCVGVDAGGMLEIFAVGTGGNMCQVAESAPNSATWTSWSNLGGTFY